MRRWRLERSVSDVVSRFAPQNQSCVVKAAARSLEGWHKHRYLGMFTATRRILPISSLAPARRLAAILLASVVAVAPIPRPGRAETTGLQDYEQNCASCHGGDGKGRGEATYVIPGMNIPDLTTIARRNGGHFPDDQVAGVIDGRHTLPSHGRFDMPFWGTTMQEEGKDFSPESEAHVKARIARIVEYVKSIQAK